AARAGAATHLAVLLYYARGDLAPGPGHPAHAGHRTGRPHGPSADNLARSVPRRAASQIRAPHGAFPPDQAHVGPGIYAHEASGKARGAPSGLGGLSSFVDSRQLV